jgi:prepilin-type N-terminal cleavage/methylation domain-containing protein
MAGEAAARPETSAGFTIIELVVAMTILVIALSGAAKLFGNAITVSGNTRARVVAQHLATQQMEKVRGTAADPTKFAGIVAGNSVTTQTVNGQKYTITEDIQWVPQNSTQSSCDSPGTNVGEIMQVTESVTWNRMAGTKPVQATTTLAPPVGAFSASSGAIAVKVLNAAGQPSASINVRIQGPVADSQQSTTQGCAFWPYLQTGTYTVSIIEGTGVGDQNVLVPSQQTSVSVGQTASLQFAYDTAADIEVSGWSHETTASPATGMALSVANTGLQPYAQYSFGVANTSLQPIFPYQSGYVVFAGACTDNNPLGKDASGNRFYPAAAPTPVNVPAGSTVSTTVDLYRMAAHVQNSSGVAVNNASVSITSKSFAAPNAINCTSGTANISPPALRLPNSNTTGDTVAAVPLGHFTLTARSGLKTRSVDIWSKPDGVYAVDGSGNATTIYTVPIVLQLP